MDELPQNCAQINVFRKLKIEIKTDYFTNIYLEYAD